MKALIALLLSAALAMANPLIVISGAPPAAVGGTFLVNEGFEGTGAPTDWGGAGDFDSTTSPLAGAQSARLVNQGITYVGPDEGTLWIKFKMKFSSLPGSDDTILDCVDSTFARVFRIILITTGELIVTDSIGATVFEFTSGQMSAGTLYYVWLRYVKGTGANATCQVYFSTTDSRPSFGTSNTAGDTDGASTEDMAYMFFFSSQTMDIDDVQISTTDF